LPSNFEQRLRNALGEGGARGIQSRGSVRVRWTRKMGQVAKVEFCP
jgi:hypothetical protein